MIERAYLPGDGAPIHARLAGPTSAPPVVLLHQTASSSAMYEPLLALLAPRFRVIAPDTPGFGQSPAVEDRPTLAGWARALDRALDALDVTGAVVFGHHTGASLAAELAAAYPARVGRLALSGPPLLDEARRAALAATPAIELAADGSHLARVWERLRTKDAAASLEVVHRELVLSAAAHASWHRAYQAVAAHDLSSCLAAIECPTLVVAGDRDGLRDCVAPAASALVRARRVTVVAIAGAGTYVCDTHASALAALLEELARPEGDR